MENFFYEETFYSDIDALMDDLSLQEKDVAALNEDWSIEVYESSLEPVFQLSVDWILDRVNEERFTEWGTEYEKIVKILQQIDYEKINSEIPKVYYGTKKKATITKEDLLEYIS